VADDQGSSKPWCGNTNKLDEGSFNGIPICPASAKETTAAGKSEIRKRLESANTASKILKAEHNNASHIGGWRHRTPEHNIGDAKHGRRGNRLQNLYSSFLLINERRNIVPKTSEAALVAAQAYLLTTQPALGDPQESMLQAAIKGLGLIGDKLNEEEIPRQDRLPHQWNSPQQGRRGQSSRSPHNESPQPCRSRSPRQANHSS
jgi:hypothetical protein